MKDKPKYRLAESLTSLDKPATARFGQMSGSAWRVSGKTMTIDEFIEDEAQHVKSVDILVFLALCPTPKERFTGEINRSFRNLRAMSSQTGSSWYPKTENSKGCY
jgi:hypothetical protein